MPFIILFLFLFLLIIIIIIIITNTSVCMCVCVNMGAYMSQSACEGQRITFKNQFFLYHISGTHLYNKHFYLLGHLTGYSFQPFFKIEVHSGFLCLSYTKARSLSRLNAYL